MTWNISCLCLIGNFPVLVIQKQKEHQIRESLPALSTRTGKNVLLDATAQKSSVISAILLYSSTINENHQEVQCGCAEVDHQEDVHGIHDE
jgi:hypothetical protein